MRVISLRDNDKRKIIHVLAIGDRLSFFDFTTDVLATRVK